MSRYEGAVRIQGSVSSLGIDESMLTDCGTCGGRRGKQPIREEAFNRPIPILTKLLVTPPTRGMEPFGNGE